MPANQSEIKATFSNPAKILLAYMRCSGITDAKMLSADLDIPLRTIQRLKLECASAISGVEDTHANDAISGVSSDNEPNATRATCAISGVSTDATCANDAISGASDASRTHARIEPPSGVSSPSEIQQQQQPRVEQVHAAVMAAAGAALNPTSIGLHMVSDVLGWMASGADLDLDIVPTIAAVSKTKPNGTINGWKFFASAVSNAVAARKAGLPPPNTAQFSNVKQFHRPTDTSGRPIKTVAEVLAMIQAEELAHAAV